MQDGRCSAGAENAECVTHEITGAGNIVQRDADSGPYKRYTASRGDSKDSNDIVADGDNTGAFGKESGMRDGEHGRTIVDGGSGIFKGTTVEHISYGGAYRGRGASHGHRGNGCRGGGGRGAGQLAVYRRR